MTAYYNEIDPFAAEWLRNLIAAGHIAAGDVDERSIEDVRPDELAGYTQCHFFAGIGVWSYALRLAGWPDDRPVWTGSCPCQPFSAAGKGAGFDDERHLWPSWFHLIEQCQPATILGEQVASKDGLGWLDLVQADLEGAGYASGAADMCAAGIGAPHIRQRLWFVAQRLDDAPSARQQSEGERSESQTRDETRLRMSREGCHAGGLEHAELPAQPRLGPFGGSYLRGQETARPARNSVANELAENASDAGMLREQGTFTSRGMADTGSERRQQVAGGALGHEAEDGSTGRFRLEPDGNHVIGGDSADRLPGPVNGHWRDADWLFCRDGKWRPVEPGTFPLADGVAGRVGRLRAYGNAIVAQTAQAFIESVMAVDQNTGLEGPKPTPENSGFGRSAL